MSEAGESLERLESDDLRLAYADLEAARSQHAAFLLERGSREAALERKAGHVQGALEAAKAFLSEEEAAAITGSGEGEGAALPVRTEAFQSEIATHRAAFDAWVEEEAERLEAALLAAVERVTGRIGRWLPHFRPQLRVEVANLAGGQAVVHLPTPRGDEAVLLCALLTGKPPETYDYLQDDAVELVGEAPALYSAGPGVDLLALREGGAKAEDALAHDSEAALLPIRHHLPLTDPVLGWPRFRLMQRGPILELESRAEGEAYTHLLPAAHAERFTGYLVALQAKGKLEVEVDLG